MDELPSLLRHSPLRCSHWRCCISSLRTHVRVRPWIVLDTCVSILSLRHWPGSTCSIRYNLCCNQETSVEQCPRSCQGLTCRGIVGRRVRSSVDLERWSNRRWCLRSFPRDECFWICIVLWEWPEMFAARHVVPDWRQCHWKPTDRGQDWNLSIRYPSFKCRRDPLLLAIVSMQIFFVFTNV